MKYIWLGNEDEKKLSPNNSQEKHIVSNQFNSVQFKMVSMRSGKAICIPPCPSEVSPSMPLKQFQCQSEWHWPVSSLWGGSSSTSSFHASFLQAIDGVMSLALCLQVASQAPRHFRSPEIQTTCNGGFAHWSVYLITSLDSSLSRTVLPTRVFSKADVKHCNMPVWAS